MFGVIVVYMSSGVLCASPSGLWGYQRGMCQCYREKEHRFGMKQMWVQICFSA